jgi:hypothetical protein
MGRCAHRQAGPQPAQGDRVTLAMYPRRSRHSFLFLTYSLDLLGKSG